MLARRGYAVRLFEGREDPRSGAPRVEGPQDADASLLKSASASKRSINLALSHRGLCAIARVDEALAKRVLEEAVPMRGRIIHGRDGKLSLQPYGTEEDEVLYSIGRQRINVFLLEELRAAEAKPAGSPGSVVTTFGAKLAYASRDGSLEFETPDGTISTTPGRVLGCDGAFSATRKAMGRMCRLSVSLEYIDHGYKEMTMAPAADGSYRMPAGGLHIWPGSDVSGSKRSTQCLRSRLCCVCVLLHKMHYWHSCGDSSPSAASTLPPPSLLTCNSQLSHFAGDANRSTKFGWVIHLHHFRRFHSARVLEDGTAGNIFTRQDYSSSRH